MDITLRQLSYFVALADTQSFNMAATRVNVSQPALSQQIKEMEQRLGTILVERLPREIRLTRSGQAVLVRARQLLADAQDLRRVAGLGRGLAGALRLGVIPTIAPYLLPVALTRLKAADLTLDIRVREAMTGQLVTDVAEGRLDAAVMSLPITAPTLRAIPLFRDRFVLAGSRSRLAGMDRAQEHLRPDTLPQDQLLLLDEGHCLADQALEVCGMGRDGRSLDLGASSLSTLSGLVAQGFGLTLLPEISLPTETRAAPELATRRFTAPEPARQVALVHRLSTPDDGWLGELADTMREAGEELIRHAAGLPQAA
ncbi:LysR family transcriptional regulator [Brevirhabdus pacifica]|uniref:LysR family transcriptional regulator n=1 Tax=Brevirhabdus pacifica TaxID=1267768 RepID=A0A1U7DF39_9RHOB|nr:hydrogen peroxide-inducible genes activator [Brevirhabdus pacifica]APX88614.1 LysR family transcriptional regulator [Brevirhabdus pacifica]OWU79895.1 LysR family transcriptional regulator [Loktanella sp. 22II-4b]PJJ86892.1 LysR family hydrogen peroxide-inducible transcriptional activator [Brevirhabdus pacifica]